VPDHSFDAIVTDPGVGTTDDLDGWTKGVPGRSFWEEFLRVVRPGAHMAVFSGRKTDHRVLTYAEEAGWEIRDKLLWLYPKGMPMSLDVGQGVGRKVGGETMAYFRTIGSMTDAQRERFLAEAASNPWWGWGTELRPSWEPIALLRAPLSESSVAANVLKHHTGAINIDAIRIDSGERDAIATHIPEGQGAAHGLALQKEQAVVGTTTLGRWPANVVLVHHDLCAKTCHPECPVAAMDAQGTGRQPPSRMFWCPKASRGEKDVGLGPKGNGHKAVKPLRLCEWLIQMICPPGGWVLDPFCGTGTTGMGVVRLAAQSRSTIPGGRLTIPGGFVGLDWDGRWIETARTRIAEALSIE